MLMIVMIVPVIVIVPMMMIMIGMATYFGYSTITLIVTGITALLRLGPVRVIRSVIASSSSEMVLHNLANPTRPLLIGFRRVRVLMIMTVTVVMVLMMIVPMMMMIMMALLFQHALMVTSGFIGIIRKLGCFGGINSKSRGQKPPTS